MPSTPVTKIERVVVFGSVGLGNDVWGPYTVEESQIAAGIDLVPQLEYEAIDPDTRRGLLLATNAIRRRVTWAEQTFNEEGQPVPTVMLEPEGG